MIRETAPAKVNLYLHVGARRPDGLHELASLFVFTGAGDEIIVELAPALLLEISGPFAAPLSSEQPEHNLVMRAARALKEFAGVSSGARIVLEKNLPIASGIGGGSADAAAALRALTRLWRLEIEPQEIRALAFALGADVPACLEGAPTLVSGAGEKLDPAPQLQPAWILLVNPGVAMPTGPIFADFDAAFPDPPAPESPAFNAHADGADLSEIFAKTRNDLEPFAIRRQSVIQGLLNRLSACQGAIGARMSGSGATVFALFSSAEDARRAEESMADRGCWTLCAPVLGASGPAWFSGRSQTND